MKGYMCIFLPPSSQLVTSRTHLLYLLSKAVLQHSPKQHQVSSYLECLKIYGERCEQKFLIPSLEIS